MAVQTIDIPISIEDLGPEGTIEDRDRFIVAFRDSVSAAFPEANVRIYAGSGFSKVYADTETEERDASDYIAQLSVDAQIEALAGPEE